MDFLLFIKILIHTQLNYYNSAAIRQNAQNILNFLANFKLRVIEKIYNGQKKLPFEIMQAIGNLADQRIIPISADIFKVAEDANTDVGDEILKLEIEFHITQIENTFQKDYTREKLLTFTEDFAYVFHNFYLSLKNRALINDKGESLFKLNKILQSFKIKPFEIPFLNYLTSELQRTQSNYKKTSYEDLSIVKNIVAIYKNMRDENQPSTNKISIQDYNSLFRSLFFNFHANLIIPSILAHTTLAEAKQTINNCFPSENVTKRSFDEILIVNAKIITEEKAKCLSKKSDGTINTPSYFYHKNKIAEQLILNIEKIILEKDWKVNYKCFSAGVTVKIQKNPNEVITKTLPNTLYSMLRVIQRAKKMAENNKHLDWCDIYDQIATLGKNAAEHRPAFFWADWRDPKLQSFYECFSKSYTQAKKYQRSLLKLV